MSGVVADITIVGLGPGPAAQRTRAAQHALDTARRIFVRGHQGFELDDLAGSEHVTDIDGLRQVDTAPGGRWAIALEVILEAAAREPVTLAIPGHPRFGEGLVRALTARAATRNLTTTVIDGISVLDLIATSLGVDPIQEGVQPMVAREALDLVRRGPFEGGRLAITPLRPVLITHVYDAAICTALGGVLERIYPADHPVTWIGAAGSDREVTRQIAVGDVRDLAGGSLVALWIPALDLLDAGADPRAMHQIVARLRQPDGCPWDRKQTNASLRDALVNEVFEAVDAIDSGDMAHLAEELGDLYLLILMHAQIAHEAGHFAIDDVYKGIATKIVRRHPHVFGDAAAHAADDVVGIWNAVKADEAATGKKHGDKEIDGQPYSMPALTRITRYAAKQDCATNGEVPSLLREVLAIVDRGEDPDTVLRQQFLEHVVARNVTETSPQDSQESTRRFFDDAGT